jgi:hypothetical protein
MPNTGLGQRLSRRATNAAHSNQRDPRMLQRQLPSRTHFRQN